MMGLCCVGANHPQPQLSTKPWMKEDETVLSPWMIEDETVLSPWMKEDETVLSWNGDVAIAGPV